MRKSHVIGGILILGFLGLGAGAFQSAATRYVSVEEARRSPRTVQVKGRVEKESIRVDPKTLSLRFDLVDDAGDRLPVTYAGAEPGGFRQAPAVVAVGRYEGGVFIAQSLLVKCPSKYEGVAESHPENLPGEPKEAR
ncbi:MAG TPA: cytochrome c maturation protein CcmE [Armatimonadota bacterium]|nr:cytochrome c maturation protein CcmE [Armatimonadota bacterium]HPO72738.1 cytochrome c maturation protein CcmE [Armatimonadota bacterium]